MHRYACIALIALAACGGDDKKSNSDAITVRGRVIDSWEFSSPNLTVSIWSSGASAPLNGVTDGSGHFEVDNVRPPYDVLVAGGSESNLFLGLTRDDPTLARTTIGIASATTSTEVTGAIGPAPADAANTRGAVIANCGDAFYNAQVTGDQDSYDGTLKGFVTGDEQCSVSLLRFNTDTDFPTTYGFISTAATLTKDHATNVDMSPIADEVTHNVTVTRNAAAGVDLGAVIVYWAPPGGHFAPQVGGAGFLATPSQTVAVPQNAKLAVVAGGVALSTSGSVITVVQELDPSVATVALDIPAGISVAAPTGTSSTTIDADAQDFTLVGTANQAYVHQFHQGAKLLVVTTADATLSATALTSHGIGLTHDTNYIWAVTAYDGVTSMDDFASGRITGYSAVTSTMTYSATPITPLKTAP